MSDWPLGSRIHAALQEIAMMRGAVRDFEHEARADAARLLSHLGLLEAAALELSDHVLLQHNDRDALGQGVSH